ncbi:MAG TPA: tRNA pseudouridine(38-40) synthase TruA [Planctomycetota bacterium]|jgi:tRNA pseudouridine38-40 synthase|nr:tRNA pseudouridine(38-40) synthase TruA [Planctomycetota bacterium]
MTSEGISSLTYRALVAYEGTRYVGFEVQENGLSIQEILEAALLTVTREAVRVDGSGRTDAGVHAEGQVVSFSLTRPMHPMKVMLALNAIMPPDVAILRIERAPSGFHARFSAQSKVYRYTILNHRARFPHFRSNTFHVPLPLDVAAMREAAATLVGTHDFTAFAKEADQKKSCVRTIYDLVISVDPPLIFIRVHGNGFLYNMVRIIAGTLIDVGLGRRSATSLKDVLQSCVRAEAGSTAPAVGLTLEHVHYAQPLVFTGDESEDAPSSSEIRQDV